MLKFAIRTFDNANSQMSSTTEDTATKDQLRLLELAKSSLNGVKHNNTNDNNKLLQTINAAFEFNNANIQKSATGDVVTKEQLKLLELAKSSSNDAKHNDNNKLLQTMNRAFENDALVNEESSKKKLEGVITISRQTKSDTVQYDKNGNIIIAEKDKTKVLNDFDESNIQISKGVTK